MQLTIATADCGGPSQTWEGAISTLATGEGQRIPVYRLIEAQALEHAESTAVIFGKDQLTYSALNSRANQLAHYLVNRGLGPERRVAVCLKPSLEIAISLLAILKAGGVYVPLDPTDPADRIHAILEDNQPECLITQAGVSSTFANIGKTHLLCVDRDWEAVAKFSPDNLDKEIELEHSAYLVYTSGTTGRPKAVVASHRNLAHYILSAQSRYGFNATDTFPAIARFAFSISLFELLSPLAAGGRLLILQREEVLNFARILQILEELTVIHASPSWWRKFLAYVQRSGADLRQLLHLRHVSSGGDIVPADLLETMRRLFRNAEVYVIYGCTEISCMGCTYLVPPDSNCTKSWLGSPFENVFLHLCDSEQRPVSDSAEGEICIGGLGVTKGYLNNPELTAEKFVIIEGRRCYRTGDLGRMVDGKLEMLGRIDFQIQLRGIRIEPGEIETHLRQIPGVRDAVVVARELGNSDKSLVAYLVLEEKEQSVDAIRQFLEQRLPQYMIPAAFVVLDAIPVNTNLKVDRRALPAPTTENLARSRRIVLPEDDWERSLVEIFQRTLGTGRISTQSSFHQLGGDSLQAIEIILAMEERWKKKLPITILLQAGSIRELAGFLQTFPAENPAQAETTRSDVVTLRRGGNRPPLFCLQGVWLYQELAQYLDNNQPVYGVFLQEEVELLKTKRYDPARSAFRSIPQVATRYLDAIRSLRPHGPYHLVGFSFAGLVAFEMAQQLQAAGEEAAVVVLIDSVIRKAALRRRLQGHWKLYREHGTDYLVNRARHRIKRAWQKRDYPGETTEAGKQPFAETTSRFGTPAQEDLLDQVSARAAESYAPQPYEGKLVLFRATDQSYFNDNSLDLGWRDFARGVFENYDVPGDHWGILKGASASILGRRLQSCLG